DWYGVTDTAGAKHCMASPRVSSVIQAVYRDYHSGESVDGAARSDLDAIDKVEHIRKLCGRVPHDSILEIGAGDGAVLNRLSAVGFGRSYAAVEISEPGLEHLRARGISNLI